MAQLKNTTINDTGFLQLPSGTTAQRPASAAAGQIRYNTSINDTEYYDGAAWRPISDSNLEATGGTVVDTDIGGVPYRIHLFTNTGNSTFTVSKGGEVEYLIVAGGGGGGRHHGGGGGAGGILQGAFNVTPQNYTITVGVGGTATPGTNSSTGGTGGSGGNSSTFGLTAIGGGGGGNYNSNGAAGGSGGGANNWSGGRSGGTGTSGQGHAGSSNNGQINFGGGGGGGGGPSPNSANNLNDGGPGISSNIAGSIVFYGGGGAAGTYPPLSVYANYTGANNGGIGGGGGGGIGQHGSGTTGAAGSTNTGGGGGGTAAYDSLGGNGGSGIVIIRYRRNQSTATNPTRTIIATQPNNFQIIRDGLVLNLDATNPVSYPGTGTVWQDLSNGRNTGTLVNGVGYNSGNGGALVFDGVNDRVDCGTFSVPFLTVSTWVYKTTSTNEQGICRKQQGWAVSNYQGVLQVAPGTSWQFYNTGYTIPLNTWVNIVYTYSGTGAAGSQTVYINGAVIYSTTAGSGAITANVNPVRVGFDDNNWFWNGRIANTLIYNRALTAQEVQQNFNATRGRYGVTDGSAPTYERLTYITSGNLTITGNGSDSVNIFKTSGANSWDNQAYSLTAFTAPCTLEFNKQAAATDNGVSYAMMGWNVDPTTNASYTSLDYTSYPYATNTYVVYHNGSFVGSFGSWSTANKFYIVYGTDGFIRHYNGSTLLYSVNYGIGNTVYVDSSFYSPNATFGGFSNIRAIRSAWNGTSYT